MTEAAREQAVSYLLGELDRVELSDFERRLASDPALRAEVERLEPTVRRLRELPRESWEADEPPPLQLPPTEPQHSPRPTSRPGWLAGLTPRRMALAGAICVALFAGGVVLGTQLGDDPEPEPAVVSIQLQPLTGTQEGANGSVELAAADGRSAEVIVDGLPPSAPGAYYELWLLRGDETVSLGSFTVGADGHADVPISVPVDPGRYDAFDVSLEREDGDPAHSGDSVLRGPTAPS
jgi:anti-sigma-K factor RskA